MDTQQTEILGRNLLVTELIRAGVEVAMPVRDRCVDLIAYIDIEDQALAADKTSRFAAVPVQMKAASSSRFSLSSKYEKISNVLLVYVWNVAGGAPPEYFALTYRQAFSVMESAGFTKTPSWKKGHYAATHVGPALIEKLEPYSMNTGKWKSVIRAAAG
jgi:hypothetical protein